MDHGSKLNFGTVQKGVIFPPKIEMVVPSENDWKSGVKTADGMGCFKTKPKINELWQEILGTKITLLTQEKLQKLAWKHQFYDVFKGGLQDKNGNRRNTLDRRIPSSIWKVFSWSLFRMSSLCVYVRIFHVRVHWYM